jgi:hypothetical protein
MRASPAARRYAAIGDLVTSLTSSSLWFVVVVVVC